MRPERPPRAARRHVALPVLAAVVVAAALRAPFLRDPVGSDEAGLLLVVRHFGAGPHPYGDYWVDRPPLLLGYFWLADRLAGVDGVRLLGLAVSTLLVVVAAWTGHHLAGRRGAVWAGGAAAVLGSSYVVAGHVMNGTPQAAALALLSCALTVAATRAGAARAHALLAAAGAAGAAAVLVKQNFVCGLVFGAVVLLASRSSGDRTTRQLLLRLLSGIAGAAAVLAGALAWVLTHGVAIDEVWFAVVEFRLLATEMTAQTSMSASRDRIDTVVLSFLLSGLALLLALFALAFPRLVRDPERARYAWGVAALLLVAGIGVVGGGSWWRHYLVQLVPSSVLIVTLLVAQRDRWVAAARAAVVLTAVSALVGGIAGAIVEDEPSEQVRVGSYLASAAEPEDTAVVLWGYAEVLLYGGLESPYPHLWSVPARTLDRDLSHLHRVVTGPQPPTWLVEWRSIRSWDGTGAERLARAVEDRYVLVGRPCGQKVYLLEGVERPVPPATCAVRRGTT